MPRPTQKPRPPFWIAALSTRESFENAGTLGHYIMGIPLGGAHMASLLAAYATRGEPPGIPAAAR